MPWFYVDDGFSDSKPVLNMPDRHRLAACGLWVLAGSWSAKEETDGLVPNSKLRQLGARPTILSALTEKGPMFAPLCERTSGGIQFNSWEKWQKTHEELDEKRREDAERQRAWRAAHPEAKPARKLRGRNAVSSDNADVSQSDTPVTDHVINPISDDVSRCDLARTGARPDPTRPDPTRPISSLVNLGEGVTQVDACEPPTRCNAHENHTDPPACHRCKQAREANEAWHTDELSRQRQAKDARLRTIAACPLCDDRGIRELSNNMTMRCDHPDDAAGSARHA